MAANFNGRKDFDDRIRLARVTPLRLFNTLDAAATYVLSGIDRAREILVARRNSIYAHDFVDLADDVVAKMDVVRALIGSGAAATSSEVWDSSLELIKLGRSAMEMRNEVARQMFFIWKYKMSVLAVNMICFLIIPIIFESLSKVLYKNNEIRQSLLGIPFEILPFYLSVSWAWTEATVKLKMEALETKEQAVDELERAANMISSTILAKICPFLEQAEDLV